MSKKICKKSVKIPRSVFKGKSYKSFDNSELYVYKEFLEEFILILEENGINFNINKNKKYDSIKENSKRDDKLLNTQDFKINLKICLHCDQLVPMDSIYCPLCGTGIPKTGNII